MAMSRCKLLRIACHSLENTATLRRVCDMLKLLHCTLKYVFCISAAPATVAVCSLMFSPMPQLRAFCFCSGWHERRIEQFIESKVVKFIHQPLRHRERVQQGLLDPHPRGSLHEIFELSKVSEDSIIEEAFVTADFT